MSRRNNLWLSDERKRGLVEGKLLRAHARFQDGESGKNTARAIGILKENAEYVCGLLALDNGNVVEHYWLRWRGTDIDVTPMQGDSKSGERAVVKRLDILAMMVWIGNHAGRFPRIFDFPDENHAVLQQWGLAAVGQTARGSGQSPSAMKADSASGPTDPKLCLKCMHAAMSDAERLTTRRLHCTALADIRVSPSGTCIRWQSRAESPLPLSDYTDLICVTSFDVAN